MQFGGQVTSRLKPMSEPIIFIQDLVKKYGDFTAVDHISLEVAPGEIFAFLGPNGAGKSTTIKMLTTLLHPTSGVIKLAGFDVVTEQNETRKSFGVVFQDPSLDNDLTAYENMELHAVLYDVSSHDLAKRIKELLTLLELWDRKDSLVRTYSGGMRRRLEIARGLLHQPKVLFLDEPTLGLDTQTRNLLWTYVQKLRKDTGMTIFMTTHYIEEAEMVADRIAFIDHGIIAVIGTTAELCKQTQTKTLEEAYLKVTGTSIRDESVSASQNWKMMRAGRNGR